MSVLLAVIFYCDCRCAGSYIAVLQVCNLNAYCLHCSCLLQALVSHHCDKPL